jgi:serine/threonine protein kinase/tetratricopeptide (TPR) repeat protein
MINDKYIIKNKIGEGRSNVYLCRDIDFPEKNIAIKVLSEDADREEEKSFVQEYHILKQLNHPCIIQVNELGVIAKFTGEEEVKPRSRFITMEYFKAGHLYSYSDRNKEKIKEIICHLSSALHYLHQSNFIYYDLKPENILAADSGEGCSVKLIDFGLAGRRYANDSFSVRGTAEYIAPELIQNLPHDHRVDLYSLGIILYRIIYNRFPFFRENELSIYKAHVEQEFTFPENDLIPGINKIVKKLLEKNPDDRYKNVPELLYDLGIEIGDEVKQSWTPIPVFANRKDAVNILNKYLIDAESSEVFSVRGTKGAGKTMLLNRISSEEGLFIYIGIDRSYSGYKFVKYILKRIVYSELYFKIPSRLHQKIDRLGDEPSEDFIEEIKFIFSQLSSLMKFNLLLDDFNLYDGFTLEILAEIIPILQVNKTKIIISEDTDYNYASAFINNLREISLGSFTDVYLEEYLSLSYYNLFPADELKKMILLYGDLLPGNLESFIKDLLLLDVIKIKGGETIIEAEEGVKKILQSSYDEIYRIRSGKLNKDELEFAEILSCFEGTVKVSLFTKIMSKSADEVYDIMNSLHLKNILGQFYIQTNPVFASEGLKTYIYQNILSKKDLHRKISDVMVQNSQEINKTELIRQLELSEDYEKTFEVLKEEILTAEKLSAYAYQKRLLEKGIKMPLSKENGDKLKKELIYVLVKLSEYKKALLLINSVKEAGVEELNFIKAVCLNNIGEPEEGKKILSQLSGKTKNESLKQKSLAEMANAEFDLTNYSEASALCVEVIDNKNSSLEDVGRCYNLLGLIDIFRDNNLNSAIINFDEAEKMYNRADLKLRVAQMEMNLGNIANLKGERAKAEYHWNRSLEINLSIGNLEQEARLLLNFGIFYYDKGEYDKSLENYKRAQDIFLSLGNRTNYGIVLTNMGDIYYILGEYEKGEEVLREAREIFRQIQNKEEEVAALATEIKLMEGLGDTERVKELLNDLEKIINEAGLGEKHKLIFNYWKEKTKKDRKKVELLRKMKVDFFNNEDKYYYYLTVIELVKLLIEEGSFKEAFNELREQGILEICEDNPVSGAERLYYLGKLSVSDPDLGLKPGLDLYREAYNLLQNLNITELTWKILVTISSSYNERGNTAKAEEFAEYANAVYGFLYEKIKSHKIKNLFVGKRERAILLDKVKKAEGI